MTATPLIPERTAQLDRYVAFDALSSLLREIVELVDDGDRDHQFPIDTGTLLVGDGKAVDGSDLDLYSALWPEDDDIDGIEYALADVRSTSITARVLMLLASDEGRDSMIQQAGRLSERVARRLYEIQIQLDKEGYL